MVDHERKKNSFLLVTIICNCGSAGKESACNAGDLGSTPGLERSPGEGKGYPPQYSGLENTVHGAAKSQTQLGDFHFHKTIVLPYNPAIVLFGIYSDELKLIFTPKPAHKCL